MSGVIGVPGSLCKVSLGIRPSLVRALASSNPMPRRAPRLFNGKTPVSRPQTLPQDALILEVRRLYEQAHLPPRKILALITGLGHARSIGWVRQTVDYHHRSHLVPALGAAPYLPESQA